DVCSSDLSSGEPNQVDSAGTSGIVGMDVLQSNTPPLSGFDTRFSMSSRSTGTVGFPSVPYRIGDNAVALPTFDWVFNFAITLLLNQTTQEPVVIGQLISLEIDSLVPKIPGTIN